MTAEVKKILVIDDNQAVHQDYRRVLETKPDNSQLCLLYTSPSPRDS